MGPCPNSIITATGKSKSGSPLQNLKTEPPTEQCRRRYPERQACYEGVTWGEGAGQTLWFACLLHLFPQFIYYCLLCASDLSSFADSVRPPVPLSSYEPTHREVTVVTRGANADAGLRSRCKRPLMRKRPLERGPSSSTGTLQPRSTSLRPAPPIDTSKESGLLHG